MFIFSIYIFGTQRSKFKYCVIKNFFRIVVKKGKKLLNIFKKFDQSIQKTTFMPKKCFVTQKKIFCRVNNVCSSTNRACHAPLSSHFYQMTFIPGNFYQRRKSSSILLKYFQHFFIMINYVLNVKNVEGDSNQSLQRIK